MPRAQRDLVSIYSRINAQFSDAALTRYRGLRLAVRTLRDNRHRSPATPENEDLKHLLYGNPPHIYRVIYRVTERQKEVEILDVRHGARQGFETGNVN